MQVLKAYEFYVAIVLQSLSCNSSRNASIVRCSFLAYAGFSYQISVWLIKLVRAIIASSCSGYSSGIYMRQEILMNMNLHTARSSIHIFIRTIVDNPSCSVPTFFHLSASYRNPCIYIYVFDQIWQNLTVPFGVQQFMKCCKLNSRSVSDRGAFY